MQARTWLAGRQLGDSAGWGYVRSLFPTKWSEAEWVDERWMLGSIDRIVDCVRSERESASACMHPHTARTRKEGSYALPSKGQC